MSRILWNGSYYDTGQLDPRPEAYARQNGRLFLTENTQVSIQNLIKYQSVRSNQGCPSGYLPAPFQFQPVLNCGNFPSGEHGAPIYANVKLAFKGSNPGLSISVSHAGNPTPNQSPNISVHTTYSLSGTPTNSGVSNYYRAFVDVGIPVAVWRRSSTSIPPGLPSNYFDITAPDIRAVGWAPKDPVFFANDAQIWDRTGSNSVGTFPGISSSEYGWSNVGWAYDFWKSSQHPVNAWFWVCVVSQSPKVLDGQSFTIFKNFPITVPLALEAPLRRIPESITASGLPSGLTLSFASRPDETVVNGVSYPASPEPMLSGAISNSVAPGTYTFNVTATNPVGSTTTPVTLNVLNPPPQYFAVGASIPSSFHVGADPVTAIHVGDTQIYPYA